MLLSEQRRAIRHLLDDTNPADASAVFFAFHYPDTKVQLVTYPFETQQAIGYVALTRTGIDLFRPFLTLRLPLNDLNAGVELIYNALIPGSGVIIDAPTAYLPLLRYLFDIQFEEHLHLYRLDASQFTPIINVLVTQAKSTNEYPRFVIRQTAAQQEELLAASGLNWLSPRFGEISVNTNPNYRRQGYGRSVVSAMCQYLLENGRIPLYLVAETNEASIQLAQNAGFVATGHHQVFLHATLKPRP